MIIQITMKYAGSLRKNSQVLKFELLLSSALHLLTAEAQLLCVAVRKEKTTQEQFLIHYEQCSGAFIGY